MIAAATAVTDLVRERRETTPDADPWVYTSRLPDNVTRPTFLAWVAELDRHPSAARTPRIDVSVETWIITPERDPARADDALAPLLADLLAVYEAAPFVVWAKAERAVLRDTWHGWRLVVTLIYQLIPTD